ncbi:hypothetical protein HNP40_000753 [Mycobacteroides chelonae]|nr:hypothetical protein [Mycobacteroides chelonae]
MSAWLGAILAGHTDRDIDNILNRKLGQYDILRDDGKKGGEILAGTTVNDLDIEGLSTLGIRNMYSLEKDAVTAIVSLPALIAPLLLTITRISSQALYFWLVLVAAVAIGTVLAVTNADPTKYRACYKARLSPVGIGIVFVNIAMGVLLILGIVGQAAVPVPAVCIEGANALSIHTDVIRSSALRFAAFIRYNIVGYW